MLLKISYKIVALFTKNYPSRIEQWLQNKRPFLKCELFYNEMIFLKKKKKKKNLGVLLSLEWMNEWMNEWKFISDKSLIGEN